MDIFLRVSQWKYLYMWERVWGTRHKHTKYYIWIGTDFLKTFQIQRITNLFIHSDNNNEILNIYIF